MTETILAIALLVVGVLLGVWLMRAAVILGYRMGRHEDIDETPEQPGFAEFDAIDEWQRQVNVANYGPEDKTVQSDGEPDEEIDI
jgi:hypothetical protein